MNDLVPCKFCGKPLQEELGCPYLESYTDTLDPDTGALSRAIFSKPIVKVKGRSIIFRCRSNG